MDPELQRLSENLKRMAAAGAKPADMDAYLKSEGVSRAQYSASVDVGRLLRQDEMAASFRNGQEGKPAMTGSEMARVMAAGLLPGFSDEVIGVVAGLLDGNRSIGEAQADEKNLLSRARSKEGSTALEMLTGFATGTGLAKLATKGIPGLSRAASILTGGLGGGAPASVMGGIAQGAKSGAIVGGISGAGEAEGNLFDRAIGGLKGGAMGVGVGGLASGLIVGGANLLDPANFNQADITQLFPDGVPARTAQKVVGELSDAMRRGGKGVDDARRAAAGMQAAGVNPLLADVGGTAMQGDISLIDALAQTRGAEASNVYKGALVPREQGRAGRRAAAVASATERPTPSYVDYVEKLEAQKTALDNIMFDRFRQEAGTYAAGRGWLKTPAQVKTMLEDPKFMEAAFKLEQEMASDAATGVLGPREAFVSPYRPLTSDGKIIGYEVKDKLHAVTLSRLARVFGDMKEEAFAVAGNKRLGRAPAAAKQMIDDMLERIPSYKEANRVSRRMHQRIEAVKQGYTRAMIDEPSAISATQRKYDGPTIALPKDVRDFLASGSDDVPEVLRGRNAIGPAKSDYEAGAQAARVKPIRRAKDPIKMNTVVGPETDQLLFGPEAAARIQASDEAEAMAARTAQSSPSAQNRIAPNKGTSPEQRAIDGATAAFRPAVRFQGNATGIALGAMDAASRAARFGVPMSPERMAGIARGQMTPAGPALNLIDQIRAASDTPMRRGLLGGTGFTMGGLLGDVWSQR